MKTLKWERILAITLTLAMMLSMMVIFTVSGNAETSGKSYTLDAADLIPFAEGTKEDGDYVKAGTSDYFTMIYSEKTKIEANSKTFSDGKACTQRVSWGSKSEIGEQMLNAIKIKTEGSASIKIWWVCGGEVTDSKEIRQVTIYAPDGTVVDKTAVSEKDVPSGDSDGIKNNAFVSTLTVSEAGIYYIGNSGGSNYFYHIEVIDNADGEAPAARADWSTVAAPEITSALDNELGKIEVSISANVGHDGGDELLVHMYSGETLVQTRGSITEGETHKISFSPKNSGDYTFKAELVRAGEESKIGADVNGSFKYPISPAYLSSATSKGNGTVLLKWTPVHEASGYYILQDGKLVATAEANATSILITGLTVGTKYNYIVQVFRGEEKLDSNSLGVTATIDEKQEWAFTVYGPSASEDKNSYKGILNEDGYVTISSQGNAGKIQPTSVDGLAFYYTVVSNDYNFTLRAKVTVDEWTLSNGQEGFGLMAMDRLPTADDEYNYWNNSYLAGSTKIEYKYRSSDEGEGEIVDNKVVDSSLKKFSLKLGIGSISRTGVTKDNIAFFAGKGDPEKGELTSTDAVNRYFTSRYYPLDTTVSDVMSENGTYNLIGNFTEAPAGTLEDRFLKTEYIMEIQRNNSGYYISYYDAKTEELISTKKYYYPDALSQIDEDNVYVGFFASRNVTATFTDVEFSQILRSEDDTPREYPDTTYITPSITVNSASVSTKENYELIVDSNVEGYLTVTYRDKEITKDFHLTREGNNLRYRQNIKLFDYDENQIKIQFTPDPYQDLDEYTELSTTRAIYVTHDLMYNRGNWHRKTLYISPDVKPYTTTADGTRENPFDIFTALENAYPGQTLILMEGTYKPGAALKIQRGMDGTEDAMIRLIADPEAETRPVIDFEGLYAGFTHGGDYWYFYGFDVTGSMDMQKGFQVSGDHNVLDQIHTYRNGNTGIQLSRLSGSDTNEDWPSYNLILNCTSYCNFDSGFEDADGFAAKLTIGEGNVFDGCIAYNNADDGWDLYAKVETGPIGSVTIRNCISYANGFVPGEGEKQGNGNGFKMGGESISGKHVLENSIAFDNLMKGIDCNSCPDIIVKNSISFNNGSHNVAFYTNNAQNTAFVANGLISFRTEKVDVKENMSPKGTQIPDDYLNSTAFYWNVDTGKSTNSNGDVITADMFVSLEFTGWTRNADGTINLNGFLEINDKVNENAAGCKLGGTPSEEIVLEEDLECKFSRAWFIEDKYAHWHLCECGNKKDVEEHTLSWIIDKPQVGMQTGIKHQECDVCGHKEAAIEIYPPEPEHTHSFVDGKCECGEVDPNYDSDHTHNYVDGKCECGATDPNHKPEHTHSYVDGKCECGATDPNYKPEHKHEFVEGKCECGEVDPNYDPDHTHSFVDGKCECGEVDPDYKEPSFFERIWLAIINFFKKLFGIKD